METLVAYDNHQRNEYHSKMPNKSFKPINCRSESMYFSPPLRKSGPKMVPESMFYSAHLTKSAPKLPNESMFLSPPLKKSYPKLPNESMFLSPPLKKSYPKMVSPSVKSRPVECTDFRKIVKSNNISFPIKVNVDLEKEGFFDEGFCYNELWAGPAYSNSPAPSALPIPKFSVCGKKSGCKSIDLPVLPVSDVCKAVKSAPSSPLRERNGEKEMFFKVDSVKESFRKGELTKDVLLKVDNVMESSPKGDVKKDASFNVDSVKETKGDLKKDVGFKVGLVKETGGKSNLEKDVFVKETLGKGGLGKEVFFEVDATETLRRILNLVVKD